MLRCIPPLMLAALLSISPRAMAHDLWLIPPERPSAEGTVTVRAHSGMAFPKSEHAPDPAKFGRRVASGPDQKSVELAAAGTDKEAGLLKFESARAGIYIVGVETTPKVLTLEADKFNAYLVEDGLPHIYLLRAKEKSLDKPGVERYSKSPKALVRVGTGGEGDPTRALGLPLEIVPLKSPFDRKPGDTLPVRVLFHGKPLADANLGWAHANDGERPRGTVRTDAKGEALVPIAKTGLMTIRLTHMTRPKHADYEWESFWTTLTWQAPE